MTGKDYICKWGIWQLYEIDGIELEKIEIYNYEIDKNAYTNDDSAKDFINKTKTKIDDIRGELFLGEYKG